MGAGKGTVVEYLVEKRGFGHYSVRAFLIKEILRRGMPENRDSMVLVANDLRARHGSSYITDQLFHEASRTGKNCIIESIRTPGEIDSLRNKGKFYLFAVDADPEIRYQRISERHSETDHISYERFISDEAREMTTSDAGKQNLKACIRQADFVFGNNGSKEALFSEVEKALVTIIS